MCGLALSGVVAACGVSNPLAERVAPIPPAVAEPAPRASTPGSLWRGEGHGLNLAADRRARRVGDLITIVLVERITAEKATEQQTNRRAQRGLELPDTSPFSAITNELFSGSVQNSFQGRGSTRQSNRLGGEFTVTVSEVLPNGVLVVAGDRRLVLTRGEEQVQLVGLVRPEDIGPDNRVASTRVADARLRYTGTGEVAAQARQGWLSRFFDRVTPF